MKRRDFLQQSAALSAAAGLSEIVTGAAVVNGADNADAGVPTVYFTKDITPEKLVELY